MLPICNIIKISVLCMIAGKTEMWQNLCIDDTSLTNMSSRFVADDNTLECKSISLGYETTNATCLKPIGLSSLTFLCLHE